MLALWLEDRALRLRDDLPVPAPGPGEARVRVLRAGICATDVELVRGYYPFTGVPGHEFVGVVDALGPATDDGAADPGNDDDDDDDDGGWLGRRVVGEINVVCGACAQCRAGRRTHCTRRQALGIHGHHGAFAEYLCLPLANLLAVPDELSSDAAAFTEPLAAALELQEQVALRPGARVLVVGAGKLGQLVAQSLALSTAQVRVVCRSAQRRAPLHARGIATCAPDEVRAGCADLAVECSGHPDGFALARRALRARGTLVLKSTYAGALTIDASSLVVDELTVVGSRCGPFAPALRLLASGRIDPMPLVSARFPLREALAAFDAARAPGAFKVLLAADAA